jgi:putative MATE family efflux protein
MNTEQKKDHLMTDGNIPKQILVFAIPLILGNLLQQLYNTADSIIVGNFVGSNALAAVGSSTSLICMLIAFGQGAAVGAGVIVSQYLGARQKNQVQDAVHTAMAMAVLLGVVLSVVGALLSRPLLLWMQTPEEVLGDSTTYLRIYFAGTLFNIMYNMASGILNAAGDSKRSLIYLACASVTNIGLDLLLVGALNMGVAGAAIATDASQLVSSVLAVWHLVRVRTDYQVTLRKIRIHKKMAVRVIQVGLPTAIQNMVISFSNVLVQSSVNLYGADAMAGFGAYMKIDGFNILPVLSISMSATTFVGQNYGAGRLDRVKKGMWVTIVMGVIYTVVVGGLLLLCANPLMRMFTSNAEAIVYGKLAMRYFCPFYFLLSIMYGFAGTVRGVGKSVPPMVILLFAMCLFRIAWIQFILPHFSTINGIFLLYPVSWTIGMSLMALYTWKGKWLNHAKV